MIQIQATHLMLQPYAELKTMIVSDFNNIFMHFSLYFIY